MTDPLIEYNRQAHRVQTAIAVLMQQDDHAFVETKHLRTGIDMTKSDHGGLVTLLIAKGVFTLEEYLAALTEAAKREADAYEKVVQAVVSNRNVTTG